MSNFFQRAFHGRSEVTVSRLWGHHQFMLEISDIGVRPSLVTGGPGDIELVVLLPCHEALVS